MFRRILVFLCKVLIRILRLVGKNGSALPGLIIERFDKRFLEATLANVNEKIVLVTGTNGKTTTTKMLVAALKGLDKKVVTNTTGSNMTRGLISALIEDMTYAGSLRETDYFVFEMDEAYAPLFTAHTKPRMLIGLNVLRDQLDRYGEVDATAKMIGDAASGADVFVYNGLDPLLSAQSAKIQSDTISFGADVELLNHIANEQTIHGVAGDVKPKRYDISLRAVESTQHTQLITVDHDAQELFKIPLQGFHNALNATAVYAALRELEPKQAKRAMQATELMPVPFGRGEKLRIANKDITVTLVKNPSGFTTNLKTFVSKESKSPILFVVNDNFADGRDVSWLWDVDLETLLPRGAELFVSGIRAYDMAVRLKQAGFTVHMVERSVRTMVDHLLKLDFSDITIIPTYTALFEVRLALSKHGEVPKIW